MNGWKKIKDNWGQILVIGAILLTVGAGYLEFRVSTIVATQLEAKGLVSPVKIAEMEKDIGSNTAGIARHESKLDRIVDILLED